MRRLRHLIVLAATFAFAPAVARAEVVKLSATLAGANEPGGGAAGASGRFAVEIDATAGDFCYVLAVSKLGKSSGAHVQKGASGATGPAVLALDVTGEGGDMCIAVEPDKLKEILADPATFYVNVDTPAFPDGAIRGQLARAN